MSIRLDLRAALHRRKMSQTELADRIGRNKSFVSELISEKKTPSWETLQQLVEVLDLEPGDIVLRGDRRPPALPAPGFHDSEAEPYMPPPAGNASLRDALRMIAPGARTPETYRLRRNYPCAGLRAGDVIVIDLSGDPKPGELVLLGDATWPKGRTVLRRWVPPFVIATEPDMPNPVERADDARFGRYGRVVGMFREGGT